MLPTGIGKRRDLLDARGHGLHTFLVELQAIEHGGTQSTRPRCFHVLGIGGEYCCAVSANGLRSSQQCGIARLPGGLRQCGTTGHSRATQAVHDRSQVAAAAFHHLHAAHVPAPA